MERNLREEGLRLKELSSLLSGLRSNKDSLLSSIGSEATALSDLSKSFKTLGGYEKALNKGLGSYQVNPSTTTRPELAFSELLSSASSLTQLEHDHLAIPLAAIDYHLRLCNSALVTVRHREDLLVQLGSLESELGKARRALSLAESTPSQFGQREGLGYNVAALEGSAIAAKQRYGQVSEMTALELSKMRALMASEFHGMLVEVAVVLLASAQKGGQGWSAHAIDEQSREL